MSANSVLLRRLIHPALIAFVLLIVVGVALTWLVRAQRLDHEWVMHSMEVREAVGQARLGIFEAEAAMRGFLITGREDFLVPFVKAKDLLPLQISNIRQLTLDNPRQQENVNKLAPLIERLLPILQQRVDIFHTSGQAVALGSITGITKALADEANAVIDAIFAEESRLLAERQNSNERSAFLVQFLAIATLLVAVTVGALNAVENARRRKEIEAGHAALQLSHERLKAEVQEREAVELQLRQAQKMEAVGQLTGGVAHDFNNMLAVIIGALDIARKRMSEGDHNVQSLIENAIAGAKRGATLTQRLLAFSRQQALEPKVLNVNALISGLSDMLRRALGESVQIEIVQGAGLWRIFADDHQLENALLNLAVNARDAMPDGGRLTVETTNTTLDSRYADDNSIEFGDYVLISVSDTGTGMPADDDYPLTHAPAQSGVAAHEPATVLVVEDDDTVRMLTIASVEELGFTVHAASGAKEALKILAAHPKISLLLTDVVMPEVTGSQLAAEARKSRPDLKVLFTTGYTRNAIVHNGTLDAGVHLISKPFTLEQLSQAIHRVMDAKTS